MKNQSRASDGLPGSVGLVVSIALLLGGCSAAPSGATSIDLSELTLVQTKSPVQLLRNDALDRVEERFVSETRYTQDSSVSCFTDDDNPDGLVRQWISSGEVELAEGADRDYVTERLVQSFTGDGWDDAQAGGPTLLSSPRSVASIEISSVDSSANGIVQVTVTGPCVVTAGADSEEVTSLS